MRIGFLFNNRAHQAYHTAAIAFELSSCYPDIKVILIPGNPEVCQLLHELSKRYPRQQVDIVKTEMALPLQLIHRLLKGLVSFDKPIVKWIHRKLFRTLDALVVPEYNSASIRKDRNLDGMKLVIVPHGAGDREISCDKRARLFDLLLLPGQKTRDRLIEQGVLTESNNYEIVGYPKFDLISKSSRRRLFDNDRPVVLYNPHFAPGLSSWKKWGLNVLEYFSNSQDYNLILSPHVLLFERHVRYGARIPKYFYKCPNILIDIGTRNSMDMTYAMSTDIYIGDMSSQIYEFLLRPRPCIFLNVHAHKWENDANFYCWRLGQVVDNIYNLDSALNNAHTLQAEYEKKQREAFEYTFDLAGNSSSRRGADAIVRFLNTVKYNHNVIYFFLFTFAHSNMLSLNTLI